MQRDINGTNGLYSAVRNQHVSMVKYLLNNVYKDDEMKMKIFNQTDGRSGKHISCIAAEKGTTQDGLVIFKLLKQNKCPIHPLAIGSAASHSSLILEYMLNEQLYQNCDYLTKELIVNTLGNARVNLVHKNVLIIFKYLSNMKDKVSINDYKQWIKNIFSNIMMYGTMDGYFQMFKEMIEMVLNNNNDWKCFTTSKVIDKPLLVNLEAKIKNPKNTSDIVDDKWCILLQTMIDSFEDNRLLDKYDDDGDDDSESDVKRIDDESNDLDVFKLIKYLENEEYIKFNQTINQFKQLNQQNIIKTVEFN